MYSCSAAGDGRRGPARVPRRGAAAGPGHAQPAARGAAPRAAAAAPCAGLVWTSHTILLYQPD